MLDVEEALEVVRGNTFGWEDEARRRGSSGLIAAQPEPDLIPVLSSNSALNFLSSIGSCPHLTLDWEFSVINSITLEA